MRMKDFLSFGVSELMGMALSKGMIDCTVIVCEGAGTFIVTDPELAQAAIDDDRPAIGEEGDGHRGEAPAIHSPNNFSPHRGREGHQNFLHFVSGLMATRGLSGSEAFDG